MQYNGEKERKYGDGHSRKRDRRDREIEKNRIQFLENMTSEKKKKMYEKEKR